MSEAPELTHLVNEEAERNKQQRDATIKGRLIEESPGSVELRLLVNDQCA